MAVGCAMAPTHVAVYFESSGFFFLLSVVPSCIEARAFVCAKPAAASASRSEMAVARVVGVAKHSFVVLVGISVHEQIARVSVFAAVAQRSVAHPQPWSGVLPVPVSVHRFEWWKPVVQLLHK